MASMAMGKVKLDWARIGEPVLAVCTIVMSVILFAKSHTQSIQFSYLLYICFTIIYHTMITVAKYVFILTIM